MTPRFLVRLFLSFYEVLNAKALRRKLVDQYTANSLHAPASLIWTIGSVPRCKALRSLPVALGSFLENAINDIRQGVFVYGGSGVRGDGNYTLASCIAVRNQCGRYVERPFSIVIGWCAVDGCYMQPVTSIA